MASDIAPAAVPDPVGQPATNTTTGPTGRPGTGLLAPIEPARPTSAAFSLDPAIATPDIAGQDNTRASSSTYQNDTDPTAKSKNGSQQQNGVMRSFALAAIERWKKGGDARNKRLDIQKAKAQAYQTKESRTVNRSEKIVGGSTNSGTASGKSTDSKSKNSGGSNANGTGKGLSKSNKSAGPKNGRSDGGSGQGGAGGSRSNGRSGNGSGGASGSGSGGSGSGRGGGGATPKPSKKDAKGQHETTSSGAGGKKTPSKTNGGTTTETATCGDSSGIRLTKDKKPKNSDGPVNTKKTPAPGPGPATRTSKDSTRKTGPGNGGAGQADATPKKPAAEDSPKIDLKKKDRQSGKREPGASSGKDSAPKAGVTPAKPTDKAKPTDTAKAADTTKSGTGNTTSTGNATPIKTQPAREAGYRDGARTAILAGHVKAYRDGFKDGHRDTSEAAEREKARLDQAHADRKQQRAKDQPVASSTDQPQGPQPIDVKEVTDKDIVLDSGQMLTRGEVRNLKQYERRMGEKATTMGKAAEGTRQLQAHAEQQAAKALKYLEMAKSLKTEGSDRVTGILTRLHEAATIQIREAQELHKRVVRAAENTRVVLTNVEIRYGGIYKAVCDSPLTKPAELNWYRK